MDPIETPVTSLSFIDFVPYQPLNLMAAHGNKAKTVDVTESNIFCGANGKFRDKKTELPVYHLNGYNCFRYLDNRTARKQAFEQLYLLPYNAALEIFASAKNAITFSAFRGEDETQSLSKKAVNWLLDCVEIPKTLIAACLMEVAMFMTLIATNRGRILCSAISRLFFGASQTLTPDSFKAYQLEARAQAAATVKLPTLAPSRPLHNRKATAG